MKRIKLVKNKIFCGIDPGLSGAIAFITETEDLAVFDMPTISVPTGRKSTKTGKMGKKRLLDFSVVKTILLDHKPTYTVSEELHARGDIKQSVQAIATSFRNYGIILGILFGLEIPYEEAKPAKWQKEFFKGKVGDTKTVSYDTACKLFTRYCEIFRGPKGGIKDGRSDAALIAEYARRKFYGG